MLSQTVEYALRAAVQLGYAYPQANTTQQIATVTKVPPAYLSKVLQSLRHAGLVQSQRGSGGGVRLARAPGEVTVLEIVNAVEPVQRIHSCPLELESHGTQLCPLHRRLDQALEAMEAAFHETTLGEVLADPSRVKPLCDVGD
jgi:Rrf2 family transcriptional regulator, nitric oxide-sensitive transcriptional repressor